MPNQFGDYTSFLETAFAVNLLFGVWGGLSALLLDKRRKVFNLYVSRFRASALDNSNGDAVLDTIQRRDIRCTKLCNDVKKWGRIFGIVAAVVISVFTFVMANAQAVEIWPEVIIFSILALPVPFACFAIFFIHHLFRFWIRISFADIVATPDDSRKADRVLETFGNDDDKVIRNC